jgi:hypothetical protein
VIDGQRSCDQGGKPDEGLPNLDEGAKRPL